MANSQKAIIVWCLSSSENLQDKSIGCGMWHSAEELSHGDHFVWRLLSSVESPKKSVSSGTFQLWRGCQNRDWCCEMVFICTGVAQMKSTMCVRHRPCEFQRVISRYVVFVSHRWVSWEKSSVWCMLSAEGMPTRRVSPFVVYCRGRGGGGGGANTNQSLCGVYCQHMGNGKQVLCGVYCLQGNFQKEISGYVVFVIHWRIT